MPSLTAHARSDDETIEIRIRAMACGLLQLMLVAIWPVAALAARVARARTTRRHGVALHRRSGAELVSAVIEHHAIEPGGRRVAHRYVYEWDLGNMSDVATPESAMRVLKDAPDLIFPFTVSGGTCIELYRILHLDDVRWPLDNGNPVLVSHVDETSFTFLTLPGHFRGAGRTIQFTIVGRDGRLILRQVGATSLGISDIAYDGGAWLSWRTQAATLRARLEHDGDPV